MRLHRSGAAVVLQGAAEAAARLRALNARSIPVHDGRWLPNPSFRAQRGSSSAADRSPPRASTSRRADSSVATLPRNDGPEGRPAAGPSALQRAQPSRGFSRARRSLAATSAALLALACNPTTRRPALAPFPEADTLAYALPVPAATERLAAQLRGAGFPVTRVEARDGYLESPWFEAEGGRPTTRRPVGPGIVRLRAWLNPGAPGTTDAAIEAVYHPVADPSLAPRLLDRPLPESHPVARRLQRLTDSLSGRLAAMQAAQAAADSARRARDAVSAGDTAAVDTAAADTARADSAAAPRPAPRPAPRRDTTAARAAPARPAPAAQPAGGFSIQIASLATEQDAAEIAARARARGFAARVVPAAGRFAVRIGDYAARDAAAAELGRVRAAFGADAFVVPR
jgi:cell division septation protein DedD